MASYPTIYDDPGFTYDIVYVPYDSPGTVDSGYVQYRYSAPGSVAGNTQQGAAGTSLGGYVSQTVINSGARDNLFPDVTGVENLADNVDYECMFVVNVHPVQTLGAAVVWVPSEVAGGSGMAIAVDNIPVTDLTTAARQADITASKNAAPIAVGPFSTPTSKANALSLGDIGPGQTRAVWVRRTATGSPVLSADGGNIRVEGSMYF